MYIYIYIHIYTFNTCIHVYVYISLSLYIYIYTYTHTYIHTCIYKAQGYSQIGSVYCAAPVRGIEEPHGTIYTREGG